MGRCGPRRQSARPRLILTIPPLFAAGEYIVGIWVGTDDETFVHGEVLDLSILPVPTDRDNIVHGAVRPNVRWDANPGDR